MVTLVTLVTSDASATSRFARPFRVCGAPPPSGLAMLPFVLGLTVGLVIAAAVALFVTRAPVPFVDRGIQRSSSSPGPAGPAGGAAESAPGSGSAGAREEEKPEGRVKPAAPPPSVSPRSPAGTAGTPAAAPANPATVPGTASAPGASGSAPATSGGGSAGQPPSAASVNQFFLQVAAFKSSEEADQMRARLAFMGYEAQISETKKDSLVFYRVRLGPYRSFEELNRAKTSLSDNGLESTVVRSSQ